MNYGFWTINIGNIIQTLGGVAGVFFAVRMSVKISNRQINHDKKKAQIKDLENFLKAYHLIKSGSDMALSASNEILIHVEEAKESLVNGPVVHAHDAINQIAESYNYAINVLNRINEDYIPLQIYNDYLVIKAIVSLYFPIVKLELDAHNNPAYFYINEIEGANSELLRYSIKIDQYANDQKKILEKLKY